MNKQAPKSARPTTRKKPRPHRVPGDVYFSQVRGKVLEDVHLGDQDDSKCVILSFTDQTELVLDIEPLLTVKADYSDWKSGDQRILKRWRRIG